MLEIKDLIIFAQTLQQAPSIFEQDSRIVWLHSKWSFSTFSKEITDSDINQLKEITIDLELLVCKK